jgi:hypothetical protein
MALRNFRQEDSLGLGIALCALLFAITFRALLPSGYMLEAQPDGVELVLCGSGGLRTIVVDADGRPIDKPAHPEDRQAEAVCAFVGMAAIAPATAGPAAPSGTLWTIRPVEIPPALPRDMRNPRGPPPLRGPPVLMI